MHNFKEENVYCQSLLYFIYVLWIKIVARILKN